MSEPAHIVVVAGEASGDAHAGRMLKALKAQHPELKISGIGGDNMRAAGVEIFTDFAELAVMGLVEVIKRYSVIKGIFNQLVERLKQEKPDLLILVDYPGFNLKLAKKAHQLGIPIMYYISPKVWAWRPGRVKTIKKYVDQMLVLFPFEQDLYEQATVPVTCVGHPLVNAVHSSLTMEQAKQAVGIEPDKKVIGLFPGSRRSEVGALLPLMLQAAERIKTNYPEVEFVLPLAPGLARDYLNSFTDQSALSIHIVDTQFYDVIQACNGIVAASGTVTLEIALMGVPHFLIYRVAPLSYTILKRLVKIPYVGLCNIVTAENLVEELLQDEVTVENIEKRLSAYLDDEQSQQQAQHVKQQVLTALGPAGGAENAAIAIAQFLKLA